MNAIFVVIYPLKKYIEKDVFFIFILMLLFTFFLSIGFQIFEQRWPFLKQISLEFHKLSNRMTPLQHSIIDSYFLQQKLYQEINERKKLLFNNLQVWKICLPRKSALKILVFAWVLKIQTFSTNEKYTTVLGINKSSFCCSYQLFFF